MGGVNQRYSWVDGGVLSEKIVFSLSIKYTEPAQIENVATTWSLDLLLLQLSIARSLGNRIQK